MKGLTDRSMNAHWRSSRMLIGPLLGNLGNSMREVPNQGNLGKTIFHASPSYCTYIVYRYVKNHYNEVSSMSIWYGCNEGRCSVHDSLSAYAWMETYHLPVPYEICYCRLSASVVPSWHKPYYLLCTYLCHRPSEIDATYSSDTVADWAFLSPSFSVASPPPYHQPNNFLAYYRPLLPACISSPHYFLHIVTARLHIVPNCLHVGGFRHA